MDTGGFAVPLDAGECFWRTWLRGFGHRPRLRSRAVHQFWYLSDARSPSRELRPRICVSPWCGDASRKCVPRNRNVNRASLCQILASLSVTPNIYAGPELWTAELGLAAADLTRTVMGQGDFRLDQLARQFMTPAASVRLVNSVDAGPVRVVAGRRIGAVGNVCSANPCCVGLRCQTVTAVNMALAPAGWGTLVRLVVDSLSRWLSEALATRRA